ncbi:MAG: TIGR03435 family protein [Bryobacteraceae bacterium]|jgi:uncharacterized protein (TIGR03435 family)
MVRLTCLILLTSFLAVPQTFEVASLKPAAPYKGGPLHIATTGGPGTDDPNRLTFSNATLTMVLQSAFDLRDNQKINAPDWLNIDMFDIAATLPRNATKDQMRIMLQNLLAERFHMAWHREKQDLPAYVMIAAKGGVRLAAPKDAASKPSRKEENTLPGTRTINCGNCTVGEFVKMLGHPEGRFVFDETGLTGTYDFALTWEPVYACKSCTSGGPDGASPPPPAPPLDQAPPVLSVALDQQLGLKLEKKQRPVDVIVIDRIDRVPVPN